MLMVLLAFNGLASMTLLALTLYCTPHYDGITLHCIPQAWLCNGAVKSIGKHGPTWEIAYNHYGNRMQMSNLSSTATLVELARPTGQGLFMVYESLSHGASSNH